MANSRPLDDQNTFLALIGHICLQWALLEHLLLGIIAAAEHMPLSKTYDYFGSMDMRGRLGMAIHLTRDAGWPLHLQQVVKNIRKALDKPEDLQWKRNQAVHGVHKSSGAPESVSLTIAKERGDKREMDVSINDLHMLVTRLIELVAEANGVLEEYGKWKFDAGSEKDIRQPQADRPGFVYEIKEYIRSALKRLFG